MTLLTVVNDAQDVLTMPRSTALYGQSTQDARQWLAILKAEGKQLCMDHDWNDLQDTTSFTCVSTNAQTGYPETDFLRLQDGTDIWNDTRQWPIRGPVKSKQWSDLIVRTTTTITQVWRLIDGVLNVYSPLAGDIIRYEWISNKWVIASSTAQSSFTADTNTFVFDEWLLTLGIVWRWRKAKGLDYAEEMMDYSRYKERVILGDKGGISRTTGDPVPKIRFGKGWPGTVTGY